MEVARPFHFENLKRALVQFAKGEPVLPQISFPKDGVFYGVERGNAEIEAVLRSIIETHEQDAVNLIIVPTGKLPLHEGGGALSTPKQVLFALTFDHVGSRLISLFELLKQGHTVEVKEVCPKDIDFRSVSIRTTSEGDLCVRIDTAKKDP